MEPHRDCSLGLCNTAEPEINCQFSEHFTYLLRSPHKLITHFYPFLFLSTFHCHLFFCHYLSSSHSAFVMLLPIISTSLQFFPHFPLLFLSYFLTYDSFPLSCISINCSMSLYPPCLRPCALLVPFLCLPHFHVEFTPRSTFPFPLQTSCISALLQSCQCSATI